MTLYILLQRYEADSDYSWDYSPYVLCEAFLTEKEAKDTKKKWEAEHNVENVTKSLPWEEDDFHRYYVIEEVELESVKPVKDPNLIKGGWIGRETECCGKCGCNLRLSAKFCDRCGTPVERQDLEDVLKRKRGKNALSL